MSIRIEPPYWFSGMKTKNLQLMFIGENVSQASFEFDIPHDSLHRVSNVSTDYAIFYLNLSEKAEVGVYKIIINDTIYYFELKSRRKWEETSDSVSCKDTIYLLMPDRFASKGINSIHNNEYNRKNPNARHGGDLNGITSHLDYLSQLGITALWLTPVLENNMPNEGSKSQYSFYHGYAITDYYNVDPHFGSLQDYISLVQESHQRNIKVIKDFVFNHCGAHHPWVKNPPMSDWISGDECGQHVLTNYKISTLFDPYAPTSEKHATIDGWFTENMPDLNLSNGHLLRYMTQMTIWWIETSGIDAIRMDTYPYVQIRSMIEWQKRIQQEYPGFSVIAETWEPEAAYTAKMQDVVYEAIPDCSFIVMDFAFQKRIERALVDSEANEMYNHFAYDFLYRFPKRVMSFLDNHDLRRWLSFVPNYRKLKLALGMLLTTPRIPQILYGTEILLSGDGKGVGDGNNRNDFPGGWDSDLCNKFLRKNRSKQENEIYRFISKLLKWRAENPEIVCGDMIHYIPQNGVSVWFRKSHTSSIMVAVNFSSQRKIVGSDRFKRELESIRCVKDILNGKSIDISKSIIMPRESIKFFTYDVSN